MHQDLWRSNTGHRSPYAELDRHIKTDVCIVGGGITGITTALRLAKAGLKVVVLEAQRLAGGTTGSSSNHLNTQIDFSYRNVEKNFDKDTARIVASSRSAAIDFIENNVRDLGIDCDFKRIDGFLYTESEEKVDTLRKEFEAASAAGLPVALTQETSLPFPVKLAVKFDNQAGFNSVKYVTGLAAHLRGQSVDIFENSRVLDFDRDDRRLVTANGSVAADHVVFATHIPLFINFHQTTCPPYRSYMIAAKVEDYPNDALYWDMQEPYHYTRLYRNEGERWLAIGGADHKTGHNKPEKNYWQDLEDYTRERYKATAFTHRWSSQYYEPADGLPYIGLTPLANTYMATGYSGDGLVYGTVAGILLSDLIVGRDNDWLKAYDARRFKPLASAKNFIEHNIHVAKEFIGERFGGEERNVVDKLEAGTGAVVEKDGQQWAVYKNDEGKLSVCSAACTHMGCIVHWNHMEKSWDCGCHGSRFSPDGKVLIAPATKDLESVTEKVKVREG